MTDSECVEFLRWALPLLHFRWPGFRKVRRQVHKRIDRRLGQLGLPGAESYREYLESHPGEWQVLDSCLRVSISRFYRDRGVFDYLDGEVLPELAQTAIRRGEREIRCWCAGCASGEEAYTLAILGSLGRFARFGGLRLRILATDADEHLLQRARRARYPASSLKDAPREWLAGPLFGCGEEYEVRAEVRVGVEFDQQDIRRRLPDGPFDLVLCRNLVFTYFDEPLQQQVLRRIVERIRPGGVLVIGKQESLPKLVKGLSPCARNLGMYRVSAVCGGG